VSRLTIEPTMNWTEQVEKLVVKIEAPRGSDEKFVKLCASQGLDCDESGLNKIWHPTIVASGVVLTFEGVNIASISDFIEEPTEQPERRVKSAEKPKPIRHEFELAPELIEETFPLLDQWKIATRAKGSYSIRLTFTDAVVKEPKAHQLSQRIYRSRISLRSDGTFRFGNVDFSFGNPRASGSRDRLRLELQWGQQLAQLPLAELITALFTLRVLVNTSQAARRSKRQR